MGVNFVCLYLLKELKNMGDQAEYEFIAERWLIIKRYAYLSRFSLT